MVGKFGPSDVFIRVERRTMKILTIQKNKSNNNRNELIENETEVAT